MSRGRGYMNRGIAFFCIFGNTIPMKIPSGSAPELLLLEKEHHIQRGDALRALETLHKTRYLALNQLQKTQVLFTHLNWKQQQRIEDVCGGNFSLQKIYSISPSNSGFTEEGLVPVISEYAASYVQHVKTIRNNILYFGIIKARAAELIDTLVKSASVFNSRYRTALRKLFPLGFISRILRTARRFFHRHYFSWQEITCLENLALAAGFVLKMAEVQIYGGER